MTRMNYFFRLIVKTCCSLPFVFVVTNGIISALIKEFAITNTQDLYFLILYLHATTALAVAGLWMGFEFKDPPEVLEKEEETKPKEPEGGC